MESSTQAIGQTGKILKKNLIEASLFLIWMESLPVKHKILVAGNHDTSVEKRLINPKDYNITYLEHESIEIECIKFFGSPYTPHFNDWAFNVSRHKLQPYWDEMPMDTDVLITHGPPKGILDIADHEEGMEYCGDKSLLNKVLEVKPKYHIFGHIHPKEHINQGTHTYQGINFMNASCLIDGANKLTSFGYIIEI